MITDDLTFMPLGQHRLILVGLVALALVAFSAALLGYTSFRKRQRQYGGLQASEQHLESDSSDKTMIRKKGTKTAPNGQRNASPRKLTREERITVGIYEAVALALSKSIGQPASHLALALAQLCDVSESSILGELISRAPSRGPKHSSFGPNDLKPTLLRVRISYTIGSTDRQESNSERSAARLNPFSASVDEEIEIYFVKDDKPKRLTVLSARDWSGIPAHVREDIIHQSSPSASASIQIYPRLMPME